MHRPTKDTGQANGLFQDLDNVLLRTMFWNADGLTQDKFSEFKQIVTSNDIDIYAIVEAGASTNNELFFQLPGYQKYVLKMARQVASGMLMAVKSSITARFRVVKEMSDADKLEAAELEVWKNGIHRRFFVIYNSPRNQPELGWLEAQ